MGHDAAASGIQPGTQWPGVIQVGIVDDHPLARRGLETILGEAGGIVVSVSAGSPDGLADTGQSGRPGFEVVLLDLYLGCDEPCLPVISELRTAAKVLVISASGKPSDVIGAIAAGASGYLSKLADAAMLVSAVRTVAAGGFALSAHLADIIRAGLAGGWPPATVCPGSGAAEGIAELSPREEQALDLIARGFTHSQAARRMGVSKATLDTYVERVRAKLQVGNKAELTRAALQRLPAGRIR